MVQTQTYSQIHGETFSGCEVENEGGKQCERKSLRVHITRLVELTYCAHMDGAHAGSVYTSHMEPTEENLLDFT